MQRFDSKVDTWLAVLLLSSAVFCICAAVYAVYSEPQLKSIWVAVALIVVGSGLPLWLMKSTYYLINNDLLTVRSGPFKWRIKLADITAVKGSKNLLSSPALSLDRLKISYGKGKFILVSPKDKNAFKQALKR